MLEYYQNKLEQLKIEDNFREIKNIIQDGKYIIFNDKKLLNLSSNDYLGISSDNSIKDNFLSQYKGKIQNASARLLSGTNKIYKELEEIVTQLTKKESAVLFNSGYHANTGIYSALLDREDVIFIDKLNHASIIDGIKLSGAKIVPFKHLNYEDLEIKLKKYRNNFKKSIISTESLFSMDGDFADLKKLAELKHKYNSLLITDEAHTFGVYGGGGGYCIQNNIQDEVDIIMGTFGKAIGSYGAYAAGKKTLINFLINYARSFIFSTALPEISVAFAKYSLENYILKGNLQEKLFLITEYAGRKIKTKSKSYIIPIIIGENNKAGLKSKELIDNGFYALPIRYPTVKKGEARIRISLNPLITKKEIDEFANLI